MPVTIVTKDLARRYFSRSQPVSDAELLALRDLHEDLLSSLMVVLPHYAKEATTINTELAVINKLIAARGLYIHD